MGHSIPSIFSETHAEYDMPKGVGALVAPNGTFDTNREEHYAYSIKATSSNPFAAGIIEGMATNVAGAGYKLQSSIKHNYLKISHEQAISYQKRFEEIYEMYAENKGISITGDKDLAQIADVAYRTQLVTGNCFALLVNQDDPETGINLKIKLLDSAYLFDNTYSLLLSESTKKLFDNNDGNQVDAVVRDNNGKIVAYTFYKQHPYNLHYMTETNGTTIDAVRIPVRNGVKRNVLHLYEPKRAGQIVAVPFVSVVAQVLEDIKEYTKAEIDAAKLNAHFAGFVYNDSPDESGGLATTTEKENDIRIGKGNLVKLEQGWKIAFADPARPSENYADFVTTKIKELCIAINYPYEMFMKIFDSSYTASRGAVIEGQKMFKIKRTNLMKDFYQPIYEQILLQEILEGRLILKDFLTDPMARLAWCGSEWIADAQEDMNKLAAIKASEASIKSGFSSHDREAKLLNGSSFEENIKTSRVETDAIEATKVPYKGEMNPQKIELAQMAIDASADLAEQSAKINPNDGGADNSRKPLKSGDKPNRHGDKKQKGDG